MSLIKDMAHMNTRASLVQFMSLKTDEVLRRFVSEIGTIENTFLVKNFLFLSPKHYIQLFTAAIL